MIVQKFLRWVETANVAERTAAASALARAYLRSDMSFDHRCAAESALTLLLDDPSPKVRAALAEALSLSASAPPQVVATLAADQPEVAALVLVRSPLLGDVDLIDRAAEGCGKIQRLIAMRCSLSSTVCAVLAEIGESEAVVELLGNDGAHIAGISLARIAERLGHEAAVRKALLAHPAIPAHVRHQLLVKVGEALSASPLVRGLIGQVRAARLVKDACTKASISLIDNTPPEETPALVEHLRLKGDLTTAFIVRAVAHGKIDFFGAILVSLSGQTEKRIAGLLSHGRDNALRALFRECGLADASHPVILRALAVWREVALGKRVTGVQEVTWLMLKELGGTPGSLVPRQAENDDLIALLKSIHLDQLRLNARGHALAIAAA